MQWWERRRLGTSLVHGPNYFLPDFAETGIITVHDLSVFRYPETHPAERIAAFEREFLRSLSRASYIITDTETVRAEVIEQFSIRPETIKAIPLGIEPNFIPRTANDIAGSLRQWGLTADNYALCVSTLEPRKKISELLRAWQILPTALRDAVPLVLCGGAGWRNEALLGQVRQGVAEGWLYHLGFVDDEQLPALYAGASLFLYPSIYEGFGLPPIEAMACGTPVMVSDRSCMPEVCGDAARYIDPDDIAAFSAAIADALEDTVWQQNSTRSGLERCRRFTWDRCVESTVELYHGIA
jgi:alpha-1,3-rhamnosyl/mannosyltransferase